MAYIGKQPTVGNFVKLDAITTSATDTFNLTNGTVAYSPQSANHCLVSLNGVIQEPTSASNVGGFTISGSTIVFTSALTTLDVIDFILVLGDVLNIGTPSDATVTFPKVTSNLITGATAETTIAGGDSVLIFDDSASALRKMTRTNFVSGISNTPAFFARKTSNQNISDATGIKCTFDSEDYDVGSCFDLANSKFVVPSGQAGKYIFYGGLDMTANANQQLGAAIVYIYKNGSIVSDFIADYTANAIAQFNYLWKDSFDLLAADYIEIYAYIDDTSGTPTINSDSTRHRTFFGGHKIIE